MSKLPSANMTPNAITTTATTERLRGICQPSRSLTTGERTKLRRTARAIGISTSRATKRNVAIRAMNKTVVIAPPDAHGTGALNDFKEGTIPTPTTQIEENTSWVTNPCTAARQLRRPGAGTGVASSACKNGVVPTAPLAIRQPLIILIGHPRDTSNCFLGYREEEAGALLRHREGLDWHDDAVPSGGEEPSRSNDCIVATVFGPKDDVPDLTHDSVI